MENNSEILTKKNINIDNLKKINTLDSTSSSFRTKKLKLKNEMSSLLKFNDKLDSKKSLDFPIYFSLFANNIKNDSPKKMEKRNKLNPLKNMKPKNLINLNINDIIKPSSKKVISRNKNYFNSLSPLNQNKFSSYTRFSSPLNNKNTQLYLNKLNYSPINLTAQKNPIIINQIGLNNPIVNLSTKLNNISNSLDQDISIIKNIKGLSISSLNYNFNVNNKKIIPSLFTSPFKSETSNKKNNTKENNKKIINNIKKKVQNEIKNFESKINYTYSKNNNINKIKINKTKENNKTKFNDKKETNSFGNKFDENNIENSKDKSINEMKNFPQRKNINKPNSFRMKSSSNKLIEDNPIKKSKFSSNQNLKKVDNKLNNTQNNFSSELYSNNSSSNLANIKKKENRKKNINDNKAKIDRLSRLKQSSLKHRFKNKKKVMIIEPKNEQIKNNNKNNGFEIKLKKNKSGILLEDKSLILLEEEKKNINDEKLVRSKTTKNIGTMRINMFKLKKNKYYLQINEKKSKKIYSNNKFLQKKNDKLSFKSSNTNRVYRKIFIRKTIMLVNMQEKINEMINKEKNKLKVPNISSIKTLEKILDSNIKRKNEDSLKHFIIKNKFKCKTSKDIYNHFISTTEFSGFSNNLVSINHKKSILINSNKKQRLKRKCFQTVKIQGLSLLNLINEKNNANKKKLEEFSITKTKLLFNNDLEWMFSPINLLTIQEIILRSNSYYYDGKNSRAIRMKFSTRRRLSHSLNTKRDLIIANRKYIKQLSLGKKFSNIDFSTLKKNIRKSTFNEFSLLYQKKFFKRAKKVKKIKGNKNVCKSDGTIKDNSENSILNSSNEESNNLEDIYFELLTDIIETKNKQFLKCFEKNEKLIDINKQLIEGNTLLIISVREGNYIISKFLCEKGVNVNIQNNLGNTALHYAIGSQLYSIADILTKYGAKEDIANRKGLLPWDCLDNNLE